LHERFCGGGFGNHIQLRLIVVGEFGGCGAGENVGGKLWLDERLRFMSDGKAQAALTPRLGGPLSTQTA